MHDNAITFTKRPSTRRHLFRRNQGVLTALVCASTLLGVAIPDYTFITAGQTAYRVLLPGTPGTLVFPSDTTLDYAAEFLVDHIERVTGARLPIIREADVTPDHPVIALGRTRLALASGAADEAMEPEGYCIRTDDLGNLLVYGEIDMQGRDRGTLFGVYHLLEQVFGIRWYFAEDRWYPAGLGIHMPSRTTIKLPRLDIQEAPRFRQRVGGVSHYTWPIEMQKRWHPVLRFGDSRPHDTPNHTQIGWTDLYGHSKPEFFAQTSSGRRHINFRHKHRSYICLTHPAVLDQMLLNIEAFDRTGESINAFGPRDPTPDYVYFSPNDGMTPQTICHCEGCRPYLRPDRSFEGISSELVFQFVRRYALAIQDRWPGRRLAVLAYAHYKAPPQEIDIPDNVDITYVGPPIQYAMDPEIYAQHSRAIHDWFDRLGGSPERIGVWMNTVSPNVYTSYVPILYHNVLQRWLVEHVQHVHAYFVNGLNPHLRRHHPRILWSGIQSYPMVWIQSRLLWNPHQDPNALLSMYCTDMFGSGADSMLELYRLITERWEGYHAADLNMEETDFIHHVRYPLGVIGRFKALLDRAASETAAEPLHHSRVTFFRDQIFSRFLEESEQFHEWSGRIPAYDCLATGDTPHVDGRLDDKIWRQVPALRLVQRQWGEPADRTTEIRLVHNGRYLYLGARLHKGPDAELTDEQLWFQVARQLDPVHQVYATNLDRQWDAFVQIQFDAQGQIGGQETAGKDYMAKTRLDGDVLMIEAQFALDDLAPGIDHAQSFALRAQFLRTWGNWMRFDLWSPTLTHISNFPTYRFGLLQFKDATAIREGASLE